MCVTLIYHCPMINRFSVAALRKKQTRALFFFVKTMVLSCWQWKIHFCFDKGCRIIGKGYLMVLKMSFSKQFQISKLLMLNLLTQSYTNNFLKAVQNTNGWFFLAKKMQMDFEWNECYTKTRWWIFQMKYKFLNRRSLWIINIFTIKQGDFSV